MYDLGNLFIISQNVSTASALLGELYVEYEVELMTPVYEASPVSVGTLVALATTGQAAATAPWGTAVVYGKGGIVLSCAGALDVAVDGLVVGATYVVAVELHGGTVTAPVYLGTSGPLTYVQGTYAADSGGSGAMVRYYTATARSGTLSFTGGAAVSTDRCRLYIAQVEL